MEKMNSLLHNGIRPIVVFDGKLNTAKLRHQDKRTKDVSEQQKDTQIEQLIHKLCISLHTNGISYITAPYEADAQLAWMSKNKIIDAVLTADSDLAVTAFYFIL